MRALRFDSFGDAAEVLRLADVAPPVPGECEVLVRLALRPINPADRLYVEGRYGDRPVMPATAGIEGLGHVASAGHEAFRLGDRVVLVGLKGTWQETVACRPEHLVAVPEGIEDGIAAQVVAGPLAAWLMVEEATRHAPAGWLVQSAAGSAFAGMVRSVARLKGWRTIDVVRRADQAASLRAAGVEHAMATEDGDIAARVREITGRGVEAALDAVGGPTGTLLVKALGPGGVMIVHGVLDGRAIEVHPGWMIAKGTSVRGFWLETWLREADEGARRAAFGAVVQALASGALPAPVDSVHDLADFKAALARAAEPGRAGKVLLSG